MKTAAIQFVVLSVFFQMFFTTEESYGAALIVACITALLRIHIKEELREVK